MKQAIIDLGTNSVKCLAVDCDSHTITDSWSVVTRLGSELSKTGKLGSEAMLRTLQAVLDMVQTLREQGIRQIRIIGTMALREALDAPQFLKQIQEASSITPEILSGQDEARLSFEAALSLSPTEEALVIDIGGGSTELSFGDQKQLNWSKSLRLGAVTLSSEFFGHDPVLPEVIIRLKAHLSKALVDFALPGERTNIIGIGGSLCTLAALAQNQKNYDPSLIHGYHLSLAQLTALCAQLSTLYIWEKEKLPGMQSGRGETILAGALLAQTILEHFGKDEIIICTEGWRHVLVCKGMPIWDAELRFGTCTGMPNSDSACGDSEIPTPSPRTWGFGDPHPKPTP